jgi:hypothetical protein
MSYVFGRNLYAGTCRERRTEIKRQMKGMQAACFGPTCHPLFPPISLSHTFSHGLVLSIKMHASRRCLSHATGNSLFLSRLFISFYPALSPKDVPNHRVECFFRNATGGRFPPFLCSPLMLIDVRRLDLHQVPLIIG